MTTQAQLRNIRLLLSYLVAMKDTELAKRYDHDSTATCTIGFAIHSKLFPEFNNSVNVTGELDYIESSSVDDVDDLIRRVFGSEYRNRVVYGTGYDTIEQHETGIKQYNAAIELIKEEFNIKPSRLMIVNTPATIEKVDDTKNKINARIAALEAYIKVSKELGGSIYTSCIDTAKAEIASLKKVLAL